MRLDKTTIAHLPLLADQDKADVLYWDEGLPGFGLRCRGGRKSWIAQFRIGHQQRRMTLGTVAKLGPDDARKAAKRLLANATVGHDPQAAKRTSRADAKATLAHVIDDYLMFKQPHVRANTFALTAMYLRKHWRPLHSDPLAKIERYDVADVLNRIEKENGPVSVIRARVALSGLFAWAISEGRADVNPVIGTTKRAEPKAREGLWRLERRPRGHRSATVC